MTIRTDMKVFVTDLPITSAKVRLFLFIKGKCPINSLSVSVALIQKRVSWLPTQIRVKWKSHLRAEIFGPNIAPIQSEKSKQHEF